MMASRLLLATTRPPSTPARQQLLRRPRSGHPSTTPPPTAATPSPPTPLPPRPPLPPEKCVSRLIVAGTQRPADLRGANDFRSVRAQGQLSFFDTTRFIPLLSTRPDADTRVTLLCRPDGFGKSLTVSMLAAFHDVANAPRYEEMFGGLDVAAAVLRGLIQPARHLVLELDFGRVATGGTKASAFGRYVNAQLEGFVARYRRCGFTLETATCDFGSHETAADNLREVVAQVARELDEIKSRTDERNALYDVQGVCAHVARLFSAPPPPFRAPLTRLQLFVLIDNFDTPARDFLLAESKEHWAAPDAGLNGAFVSFFRAVQSGMDSHSHGISQVYMTGVAPLLLSRDVFGPFGCGGIADLSFDHRFFRLCGFTAADVSHALNVIKRCGAEAKRLLDRLRECTPSHHFSSERKALKVYHASTVAEYLSVRDHLTPSPRIAAAH